MSQTRFAMFRREPRNSAEPRDRGRAAVWWSALLLALGVAGLMGETRAAVPRPPGVVVAYSPASSRQYLGSPSLVLLPGGEYLVSHDFFGPGSTADVVEVHASGDRGVTWEKRSRIRGGFWSNLFVHRGSVYLLGTSRQDGQVVIRRSGDAGRSWTEPADGGSGLLLGDVKYHGAPMPVVEHRGRLWRAFEDIMGPGRWGSYFNSFVISAPVDADLLVATNWVTTRRLGRDPGWLGGKFGGWLEGNVVVTPEGGLVNLLRADVREARERAAMIRIGPEPTEAAFDPEGGFVEFPGGCKKFTVRRDEREGVYWALSNFVPESQRGGNVERTRNTLALSLSSDLRTWEVRAILLHHPDAVTHGFQYPDWQFDGDDLVAAVRTAFDDEVGGAHNCHDANFVTFHRWRSFRTLRSSLEPEVAR